VIGRFAKESRYQGAGSSLINPTRIDNLYDEMAKLVGEENLSYAPGYDAIGDEADEALITEAVQLAETADVVLIHAGLTDMYEVEGLDREHMNLPPGHDALIATVTAVHDKVVVVLSNGSPVAMPWVGDAAAILEGYLGGQAGAGALADILYGKVNPSGKLAETFPISLEDNPSYHYFPGGPGTVEYRESIYVGYRYYDTVEQEVLFPFGHGLSYTSFTYSDLQLSQKSIADTDSLVVTLKVKNTGPVAGKEIVQLYVHDVEAAVFRPEKELKGFTKVDLQPGEEAIVTFELERRAFAYYDVENSTWAVESGTFDILVGASAQDIRLQGAVEVTSAQSMAASPNGDTATVYHNLSKGLSISQEDFEKMLGRPVPANGVAKKGTYSINTPLCDMRDSFVGRRLCSYVEKQMSKMIPEQENTPTGLLMRAVVREMPLRTLSMMGNAQVPQEVLDSIIEMANGHYVHAVGGMLQALRNR
jgi:beta-glucosidase